jgi:fatty-acyl-CoA synthase
MIKNFQILPNQKILKQISKKLFTKTKKEKILIKLIKSSNFNFSLKSNLNSSSNLSYTEGNISIKLREVSIGEQLNLTSKKFPNNDAIYVNHQNLKLSYEEFNLKVSQTAKAFISLGLTRDSKVAIYSSNCVEWALTQFACARIGIPFANINPAYQINDLKYSLNVLGINTLIMSRKIKTTDYIEIVNKINLDLKNSNQNPIDLNLKELPNLKQIILLDDLASGEIIQNNKQEMKKISNENNMILWDELMDSIPLSNFINNNIILNSVEKKYNDMKKYVKIHDAINIQFTSGTTGLPKGAVLSHYNILNNAYLIGNNLNYTEKDKVLITVPLYHCFGSVMGNLACINFGSTIVYSNSVFDSIKTLDVIENYKCTSLYGVPTMFLDILEKQKLAKKNMKSLRTGIMAGSICSKFLMERCIEELYLKDLTICYGMTELSPVTHQTSISDDIDKKTQTVGTNLPHSITKIVDENGEIVPRGQKGEICSKGFGLFKGYFANENATKNTIDKDGFMKTGDIGFIDNDGYLYIEGRIKDTIIRGGENISPKEIEDFLGTNFKIENVQVIAVKDEKYGDEICAWIKLKKEYHGKTDKKEIIEFCKKNIAHYKIPRYIKFVENFPMTITGKPQKFMMRDITNKILEDKSENL